MKTTIMGMIIGMLFVVCQLIAQESKSGAGAVVQEKSATTSEWRSYGDAITLKKPASFVKALKNKKQYGEKEILLEGTISEVCQNKGCWMVVDADKSHLRVEFKDYGFFVPWDSEGKKVRMQGIIHEKKVSAKSAEHMASEMKNPPVGKDNLEGEQTITVFTASAVAIKGGSDISTEQQEIIDGKKEKEGHQHEEHGH
jgi:hypothetical protein